MAEKSFAETIDERLAAIERIVAMLSEDGGQADLRDLRIVLIDVIGLLKRDPGVEAAVDDLYAAARCLVVDREVGSQPQARKLRLLRDARQRFHDRLIAASEKVPRNTGSCRVRLQCMRRIWSRVWSRSTSAGTASCPHKDPPALGPLRQASLLKRMSPPLAWSRRGFSDVRAYPQVARLNLSPLQNRNPPEMQTAARQAYGDPGLARTVSPLCRLKQRNRHDDLPGSWGAKAGDVFLFGPEAAQGCGARVARLEPRKCLGRLGRGKNPRNRPMFRRSGITT